MPTAVLRLGETFASALGTVGFAGGLGLLVAGLGVPSLVVRLTPRWFAWVGLVLAAVSEISFLGLLWNGFDLLFPAIGLIDLAWLVAIGVLLPRSRHDLPRSARGA